MAFQSTPSSRRATSEYLQNTLTAFPFNPRPPHGGRPHDGGRTRPSGLAFNPRPPHGGRRRQGADQVGAGGLSIHALLTEGDKKPVVLHPGGDNFQSTPSSRRATQRGVPGRRSHLGFQSTPSSRRATLSSLAALALWCFQSTPSSRRATNHAAGTTGVNRLSIHALLTEGDKASCSFT